MAASLLCHLLASAMMCHCQQNDMLQCMIKQHVNPITQQLTREWERKQQCAPMPLTRAPMEKARVVLATRRRRSGAGTPHCAEGESVRYSGDTLKTLCCRHGTQLHHATPDHSHHHGRVEQEEREGAPGVPGSYI